MLPGEIVGNGGGLSLRTMPSGAALIHFDDDHGAVLRLAPTALLENEQYPVEISVWGSGAPRDCALVVPVKAADLSAALALAAAYAIALYYLPPSASEEFV